MPDGAAERQRAEVELKARKLIGRQLDALIRGGAKCVERLEGSKMEKSQIRNLVNLAAASESVEEVTNFIRYQIGRDGKGETWSHNGFGKALISDIETGQVSSALDAVMKEVPDADRVAVRSELIALYLGYLNRRFQYAKGTADWEATDPIPAASEEAQDRV